MTAGFDNKTDTSILGSDPDEGLLELIRHERVAFASQGDVSHRHMISSELRVHDVGVAVSLPHDAFAKISRELGLRVRSGVFILDVVLLSNTFVVDEKVFSEVSKASGV